MHPLPHTRPLIIGHRGASGDHPENTLGAFRLALRQGANAIEMDVHQTRDGALVIHHDLNLRRLAGLAQNIRDLDLADLRKLTLKVPRRGSVRRARIPTLDEAIRLIRGRALIILEVKKGGDYYPGIEDRIIHTLRRSALGRRVVVSSFELPILRRLRKLSANVDLGYLTRDTDPDAILQTTRSIGASSVHIASRRVSRELLRVVHAGRLPVYVYTVNAGFQMRRLLKMGADGLFTDYPARLRLVLKTMRLPARS